MVVGRTVNIVACFYGREAGREELSGRQAHAQAHAMPCWHSKHASQGRSPSPSPPPACLASPSSSPLLPLPFERDREKEMMPLF